MRNGCRMAGQRGTYDWGRRPLGFQSRSRDSSEKPVSAMVAASLAVVLSLLAGWGGLAVGDEEAIPTDGWFCDGMVCDDRIASWPVCLVCNVEVVYAKLLAREC